jgi:hypothetical protein
MRECLTVLAALFTGETGTPDRLADQLAGLTARDLDRTARR